MSSEKENTLASLSSAPTSASESTPFGLTRRQVLKAGILAPAGVIAAKATLNSLDAKADSANLGSPYTTPWKDPLPILPKAVPLDITSSEFFTKYYCESYDHQGSVYSDFAPKKFYHHKYTESQHKFHSDLPFNTVWGWDGHFGGPTIIGHYGEPIIVRRTNTLDPYHVGFGNPVVSTHLHNAHSPAESDGNPQYQVFPGQYKDYHYPHVYAGFSKGEDRDPKTGAPWEAQSTLWYHDHMLDYTSQNVYMGLAGFHLMFNEYDTGDETGTTYPLTNFRLPSGEFDIPLIFIDMKFDSSGVRLFDLFALDGHLGDKFTVNGQIQPYHKVAKRKYRLRLLNSGPSRFYAFSFSNKMPFQVIGIDGNLLPAPITMTSITLAPAERADIVVNFNDPKFPLPVGKSVYLQNTLEQVNGRGPNGKTLSVPDKLIRFDVDRTAIDPSQVPAKFYPLPTIPAAKLALSGLTSLKTRTRADRSFLFDRSQGAWTVNGKIYDPTSVSAVLPLNAEEVWEIRGSGDWAHPVHIHFEEFRILSRNGLLPPIQERGRKDVIYLHPGEVVRIFMRFRDFEGRYVMHCHNVVHEDHAMMVNLTVSNPDPVIAPGGKDILPADYTNLCNGLLT